MELAFNSKKLRTICENEAEAQRQLGLEATEYLKHRLADLRAAISVKDLIVGRPQNLDDSSDMSIDLFSDYRLVFAANHPRNPITKSGEIDWERVSRIKILRIENNNA